MKDLANLFDEVLGDLKGAEFPTFPTSNDACGNSQAIEINRVSHISYISHAESDQNKIQAVISPEKHDVSLSSGLRVTSSYAGEVGNVGKDGKTLAGSASYLFPQKIDEVGNVGKDDFLPERPILDLNRAAPQRSDWWTGPLMVEVDRTAAALPISPEQVRAGVERELRARADLGRDGPDALRDAIEITRAKIWNSEALAERQVHDGRCHDCKEPLDDDAPMVAILSAARGKHLFMHSGCHAEHIRRREALVDKIMVAAGYGADRQDGVSA